jgi:diguanylate cyclase (GGDEF)-like protein
MTTKHQAQRKPPQAQQLQQRLDGIQSVLSVLHGEVAGLETSYHQVLGVLQKLEGLVALDDLTGLLRRNAFFRKWEQLLEQCRELNESCGVLLIDIDHFKKINDTHGHPTGDEVIRRVSSLLRDFDGPGCCAGRLGGEEFAVAVRGNDAEVLGVAEMIRRGAERLHGPVVAADGSSDASVEWKCTVSVGMASTAGSRTSDPEALIRAADEALYEAKEKGRNQVRAA